MYFITKKAAKVYYSGDDMQIFTQKELDEKAWGWLSEEDSSASISEWFLARDGFKLWMIVLYKRPGVKGVYSLQKLVYDCASNS